MRAYHHRSRGRPGSLGGLGSLGLLGLLGLLLAGCAVPAAPAPAPAPDQAPDQARELGPWAWEMPRCVAFQPEVYVAARHRISASAPEGPGRDAGTTIEVYEPGWGARAVEEVRDVVRTCGSYEDGDLREQHLIVETGFVADESLLVETVRMTPPDPPQTSYTAVVLHGDVVVTMHASTLAAAQLLCLTGGELATCPPGQA